MKRIFPALLCCALLLSGCGSGPGTVTEPIPLTTAPDTPIIPEIPVVHASKTFDHQGLQITLNESYTTRTEGSILYFESATVRGGIEFGDTASLTAGMADTSGGFAEYLKNSLSPYFSQISTGVHNGQSHVVIPAGDKTLLRTLYVHDRFAWSVWAETTDAALTETLATAIDGCTLLEDQLPPSESTGQTAELCGLMLSGNTVADELRSGDTLTAVIDSLPCQITTGSIALLTNNITPAIMAQEALDALEEGKDTAQLAEENGVSALIVPTQEGFTATGYYIKNGRFWTVSAQGADSSSLLQLVTSATTDDLSYTRLLRYNLASYPSLAALLEELQAQGQADWGRHTLRLDGLSVPMTLRLYGTRLESISIYTHNVEITHPCYLDSSSVLTQQENLVILNLWQGKTGYTWLFTPEMYQYYHPTGGTSLMVFPEETGALRFTHHSLRLNHQEDLLEHIINRKEFYYEEGPASFADGQLSLEPQTTHCVSDVQDLDALFLQAKEQGKFPEVDTLDQLLYQHLIQYPR